jgi:hypothetical protein
MQSILNTKNNINEKYGNRYIIYNLFINHTNNYYNFIKYLIINFELPNNIIELLKFNDMFSDADFYIKLQKYYNKNIKHIKVYQENMYTKKHIIKKVLSIKNVLNNIKVKKVLDMGTENIYFLQKLDEILYCKSYGLNILDGYSHYFNSKNTNKIIIYNGINFPFIENEFDLVIMISVLHHIKNLKKFINNLCKITKYIYIKDNNMVLNETFDIIKLQHEVYEGILYPNKNSDLYKLNKKYLIKLLEQNNFYIKYINEYESFTHPFQLLCYKKI